MLYFYLLYVYLGFIVLLSIGLEYEYKYTVRVDE